MLWKSAGTSWRLSNPSTKLHDITSHGRRSLPLLVLQPPIRSWHCSAQLRQRNTHTELQERIQKHRPIPNARVQGLVRSIRRQKRIAFAHISDGSTSEPIHAVAQPASLVDSITNGSYVDITGRWEKSPGKGQSHDLQIENINELGLGDIMEATRRDGENPIQKKATSAEFLRGIPHLRMRTGLGSLVARSRAQITRTVAEYFETIEDAAIQVHPPVITSSDCEGAGEVFTIAPASASQLPAGEKQQHFFGEPKYLTVSNQLHLEAYAAELGNVWSLAPTFRAEASETPRHLAEFYMLEAEFRGTDSLHEVIDHAEALVRFVTKRLQDSRVGHEFIDYYTNPKKATTADGEEPPIHDLEARWDAILHGGPWQRITYASAVELLEEAHSKEPDLFEFAPSWEGGLALEHEKWLAGEFSGNRPVVVTDYPKKQKPFYMLPSEKRSAADPADSPDSEKRPNSDDGSRQRETAACFDILLPYGYAEVCGGSLREHRLEYLIAAMRGKGLLKPKALDGEAPAPLARSRYPFLQPRESLNALQWYADLRRFGSSPHGGFGIGFDRLLAYLVGVSNVRDVVGFPRGFRKCDC